MKLILEEMPDETIDALLSLSPKERCVYYEKLADRHYPDIKKGSDEYHQLIESYNSSFYVEKLYRTNRFFNEQYTIVYTDTGLIRNVISDLFFADDDLITH